MSRNTVRAKATRAQSALNEIVQRLVEAFHPEKIELCREWLTIATSDLRAASILTQASPPAIHQALYFCQQCSEKTLKAFLVWHDVLPMKIHDLKILGEECARIDSSLGNLIPQVASLTAYGSMYRYPGGSELR